LLSPAVAKKNPASNLWWEFAFEALAAVSAGIYKAWTEDKAVVRRVPKKRKPAIARKRALPKWWKVLRVSQAATPQEIKTAYRARMHESHPDKVAHLSPTLRRAAEREAKRINDAYERASQR
jgi:DnaJ-domain-containing protein 1